MDATYTQAVPRRPSHGASGSELVLLRIALELAPGGLLGNGLPRRADRQDVRGVGRGRRTG